MLENLNAPTSGRTNEHCPSKAFQRRITGTFGRHRAKEEGERASERTPVSRSSSGRRLSIIINREFIRRKGRGERDAGREPSRKLGFRMKRGHETRGDLRILKFIICAMRERKRKAPIHDLLRTENESSDWMSEGSRLSTDQGPSSSSSSFSLHPQRREVQPINSAFGLLRDE